ncbi:hypothetical protein [Mycoplasmopsis bovirhinis]|uniref:hypothetical protein n=1 Tax=Mycoplasmopsis bovirhinis TaxID=29553 RepID=UPI0012FE4981|nr:hypothetical protein [Mycoplasmopsis bovirhinis]
MFHIKAPINVLESHVYWSIILTQKTKQIVGFKLPQSNNLELVMDNLNSLKHCKPKIFIIHSDHGFQYTHQTYINEVQNLGGIILLSSVGNSLDNQEIKYCFGIIKTWIIKWFRLFKNNIQWTKWYDTRIYSLYNNDRIQPNLNWKCHSNLLWRYNWLKC